MDKMIWSDSLQEMVVSGFTRQAVLFGNNGYKKCKKVHYSWNDEDCVYYNDDRDDDFYMEVPYVKGWKAWCYNPDFTHKRYIIRIDKEVI